VGVASAESIRQAILAGDYEGGLSRWQQYAAEMAAAGPTRESLAEAAELIEWARPLLHTARSTAAERLRVLHVASMYGQPVTRSRSWVGANF
jgi:hypothetical protein